MCGLENFAVYSPTTTIGVLDGLLMWLPTAVYNTEGNKWKRINYDITV